MIHVASSTKLVLAPKPVNPGGIEGIPGIFMFRPTYQGPALEDEPSKGEEKSIASGATCVVLVSSYLVVLLGGLPLFVSGVGDTRVVSKGLDGALRFLGQCGPSLLYEVRTCYKYNEQAVHA